jgi:thiosulfate/3-mercaptopyruvate sulfurtransferase
MSSLLQRIPKQAILLDCSWYLNQPTKGFELYQKGHIPHARFYDLDRYSNQLSSFPHMLPTESEFKESMQRLGIHNKDHVVCYDQGMFSAPRVWWTLRQFGHERVSVLDGGLQRYLAMGGELSDQVESWEQSAYTVGTRREERIEYPEFVKAVTDYSTTSFQVIDARSEGRFAGSEPEPRPIPSGHCPTATNLFFKRLINDQGCLRPKEELETLFRDVGISLDKPIVTMCGSGVTACIVFLALDQLGVKNVRLYDGSWSEYAHYKNSPIITYP